MSLRAMALGGFAALLLPASVFAQAPLPPSAVVSSTGTYFWADGAFQHVYLPSVALGAHLSSVFGTPDDLGLVQSFRQSLGGPSVTGGVGFYLPAHAVPAGVRAVRVELNGGYGRATQSQAFAAVV